VVGVPDQPLGAEGEIDLDLGADLQVSRRNVALQKNKAVIVLGTEWVIEVPGCVLRPYF